jgi:hypothetical protein
LDLKKQFQQHVAEKSQLNRVRLEHQVDVLQETLKRFQETLKGSEALESDLKKQLQEQQWQAVQAPAEDKTQAKACESEVEKETERAVREAGEYIRSMKTAVSREHSAHLPKVVRALSQWYFPKP